MTPLSDYEEQIRGVNRLRDICITDEMRLACYNQAVYDDMRLESTEYFGLKMAVRSATVMTTVDPIYSSTSVMIIDNDSKASCLCAYNA